MSWPKSFTAMIWDTISRSDASFRFLKTVRCSQAQMRPSHWVVRRLFVNSPDIASMFDIAQISGVLVIVEAEMVTSKFKITHAQKDCR